MGGIKSQGIVSAIQNLVPAMKNRTRDGSTTNAVSAIIASTIKYEDEDMGMKKTV